MTKIVGALDVRSLTVLLLSVVLVTPLAAAQDSPEYASDVVVVQFAPEVVMANKTSTAGLQEFDRRAARYDVHLIERVYPFLDHVEPTPKTRRNLLALRNTYYVRYAASAAPKQVAGDLAAAPGVVYAEPVLVNRTQTLDSWERVNPDDPRFGDQPELQLMRFPEAWDVVRGEEGSPRVVIAVVDGGGEWRHEDLRENVWTNPDEVAGNGVDDDGNGFIDDVHGVNLANGDDTDNDPTGLPETAYNANHGTASAGPASAVTDNGVGVAGAAWNARIMHINAGCPGLDGNICYGYEGILYAAANGADVINASWSSLVGTDDQVRLPDETLNLATDMGALVVASADNENANIDLSRVYPARHPRVLSVGATEKTTRRRAGFSNYGKLVNVFAPGVDILTTGSGNGYISISGTSFSSPLTAGVAALVKTKFPDLTPDALREHIRLTSDNMDAENPAYSGRLGRGFVNAWAAVQAPALPAVRLKRWSWADDDGDRQIASGDVVTVTATVVNYLADARQLRVGLVGAEPYPFIDLVTSEVDVGYLASGDSVEVRFEFAASADAPANQRVRFYTRMREGAHEDEADMLSFRVNRSIELLHQSLSAFYTATGGNQWTHNDNWDITTIPSEEELATWFGVGFSEGWLTTLHLRQNNLTGTLPPELSDLPQLQLLDLGDNPLTGPIPPELGSLPQLRVLYLRNNDLTGPIPPELGSLTQLTWLHLRSNDLTGPIPPELGNLPQLEWLFLDGNSLTGSIPLELSSLPNLTWLGLGANSLTGPIPPELSSLPQLQRLELDGNLLTGSIPPELGNLTQLQWLYLNSNSLSGSIPPELGSLAQLQKLVLSYNDLTGPIPSELGSLPQLQLLALSGNSLTGPIPSELGNLQQLQQLFLPSTSLTGSIPPELGNLSQLQWLDLQENSFSGEIPPELGSLAQLQQLDLRENSFSGEIPPELGNLLQLRELSLTNNSLTGPIPPELANLSQLEVLGLTHNLLTGPIPPELANLSQLQLLFLDANDLTGSIPPELGSLPQLQSLWLRSNSLTGPIPPELGNLPQLRGLHLENNSLTGSIPSELVNLPQLRGLYLGNNDLTEPIPPELGNLPQMRWVELQDNSLIGPIPPELGSLPQLEWLELTGNSLTGPIPPELGNLPQLRGLYLDGNSLTGMLPRSLMQLDNLDTFHFGGQELCAPQDNEFQAWLSGIPNVDGPTCAGLQFASTIADQNFPRAHPIAPLVLPEATGGVPPINYMLTPTLPIGLSFDASTRTISGTPTTVTAGPVPYTYRATDVNGSTDSLRFNIEVHSPVATEHETVPESFAVYGNYPNPFRQSTRIVFDLPWPARVTVEVMDVTGRRVHTVPPVDLAAGWEHDIELRGGKLSSGLYLYHLMATSPEGNSMHVGRLVRLR